MPKVPKEIKIGVLIDRVIPGGAEKIAIKQVQTFRELGYDARLLVINKVDKKGMEGKPFLDILGEIPIDYLSDRIPKILRFDFKIPFFSFFSFFHFSYPFLIPFGVKRKEFDIIISHGTYTCFTAMALAKRRDIPYAAYIWDPVTYILRKGYPKGPIKFLGFILSPIALFLDKQILKNASFLLVGGRAHNEYFQKISHKEIHVIPPSYNPIPNLLSKRGDYFLAVTAWKPGKDPEFFFKLMKYFSKFKLRLAGSWLSKEYKEEYEKGVIACGLAKQIEVLGAVSEKKLVELYSKARVLVQINDDRGFGMPALEAAACGCPFVIPKGQGVCELFEDKVDGFFIKERDWDQIVETLSLLISNERISWKMGSHAWKVVCEKYSWRKHIERLLSIFRSVLEEGESTGERS